MPAGDAQRAWFPEMLSELDRFWRTDPDWTAVITFCEAMTSLRAEIKARRGIRTPLMMCRGCGTKHEMTLPPISPRSLLYALKKIDLIGDDELKRLDKDWKLFRKQNDLYAGGHPVGDDDREAPACA